MLSPVKVILTHVASVVCVPFILNCSNLGDLVPHLATRLGVDYYVQKVEPVVLCLGAVTFYSYVFLGFVFDLAQAFRRNTTAHNGAELHRSQLLLNRFERAHRQLRKVFPPFVVSCLLMYANTTRFDTLRNSFMLLQTFLLILQPIASMCPKPQPGLICKYVFHGVLFWSLLYAVFPRESQHYISEITHFFNQYLYSDSYGYRRQHSRYPITSYYDKSNGNSNQWIL